VGQGDNQIIVARLTQEQVPISQTIALDFFRNLADEFRDKNAILNETESWYSNSLLESNILYYQGKQLSNGLKYASKVATDANDAPNTFETRISSIATTCEAVAKRITNPDVAYMVSCFEVITQVWEAKLFGNDVSKYDFVPAWTTSLGGLPVATYTQLTMRGYPDRLCAGLSFAKYLFKTDRKCFQRLSSVSPLQFRPNPSMELFMMDPHALDLETFFGTSGVLKDAVNRIVRSVATNPTITRYFNDTVENEKMSLIQTISSLRPYAAHLASELFRCSNVGLVLQYTALFDNNRTLMQMAQKSDSGDMLTKVHQLEDQFKRRVSEMFRNPARSFKLYQIMIRDECTTKTARDLRRECFGMEVHGGTNALPVDQVRFITEKSVPESLREKSIMVTVQSYSME